MPTRKLLHEVDRGDVLVRFPLDTEKKKWNERVRRVEHRSVCGEVSLTLESGEKVTRSWHVPVLVDTGKKVPPSTLKSICEKCGRKVDVVYEVTHDKTILAFGKKVCLACADQVVAEHRDLRREK